MRDWNLNIIASKCHILLPQSFHEIHMLFCWYKSDVCFYSRYVQIQCVHLILRIADEIVLTNVVCLFSFIIWDYSIIMYAVGDFQKNTHAVTSRGGRQFCKLSVLEIPCAFLWSHFTGSNVCLGRWSCSLHYFRCIELLSGFGFVKYGEKPV